MPAKKKTNKAKSGGALQNALAGLSKVIKNSDDMVAQLDHSTLREPSPHIPTGSLVVDYLIGGIPNRYGVRPCPGIPRGKIMNLYGQAGAGKTTLALTTAASTCALGGTVAYIDWENEVDPRYAEILGVPVTDQAKFMLFQPSTLEEGFKIMWACAQSGVDLIVVDSVGAGVPEDWFTSDDKGEQGRVGMVAAKWSKFLPQIKVVANKSNTAILGISQLRSKISTGMGRGPTEQAQGGKAWQFYSCTRMMLRVFGKEKEKVFNHLTGKTDEQISGTKVIAKLDKCKVSGAFGHQQMFYLKSGYGIDDIRTIIEIGIAYNVIRKGGAWYTWTANDGTEVKGQGMGGFRKLLEDREGALNEIFAQIEPHLSASNQEVAEDEPAEDAASILEGLEI